MYLGNYFSKRCTTIFILLFIYFILSHSFQSANYLNNCHLHRCITALLYFIRIHLLAYGFLSKSYRIVISIFSFITILNFMQYNFSLPLPHSHHYTLRRTIVKLRGFPPIKQNWKCVLTRNWRFTNTEAGSFSSFLRLSDFLISDSLG